MTHPIYHRPRKRLHHQPRHAIRCVFVRIIHLQRALETPLPEHIFSFSITPRQYRVLPRPLPPGLQHAAAAVTLVVVDVHGDDGLRCVVRKTVVPRQLLHRRAPVWVCDPVRLDEEFVEHNLGLVVVFGRGVAAANGDPGGDHDGIVGWLALGSFAAWFIFARFEIGFAHFCGRGSDTGGICGGDGGDVSRCRVDLQLGDVG